MITGEIEEALKKLLTDVMIEYKDDIKEKIKQRGLVLTGALLNSVTARVEKTPGGFKGVILLNDYGLTWETGIPKEKIAAYISSQGNILAKLEAYMRKRNATNPRAAAFSTIKVWKREGAPTRASKRFSNAPGKTRTGFIKSSVEERQQQVIERFQSEVENIILFSITQTARELRTIFAA